MSADTAAVLIVLGMAPAVTLLPALYGYSVAFWESLLGWGLMVSSVGMALLVDISLLYQVFGDDYYFRDVVRFTVYGLIFVGNWTLLAALLREKWRARRGA